MSSSSEQLWKTENDLRTVGDRLMQIARLLHEHSRKLENAVEVKYASEGSDPRVRMLSDALNVSRIADLELGRLNLALQRVLQAQHSQGNGAAAAP